MSRCAWDELRGAARRLRDATRELELIAVEDRPRREDLHLFDAVQDSVFELAGAAEEAVGVLAGHMLAPDGPVDPPGLAALHRGLIHYGSTLTLELASPRRIGELSDLVSHGKEAGAWAREVIAGAENCQRLLWTELHGALLDCWADVTDRVRKG